MEGGLRLVEKAALSGPLSGNYFVLTVWPSGEAPATGAYLPEITWIYGAPYGTRTRVSAVKGRRPGPLDEGR